jgi:hypothetical protein
MIASLAAMGIRSRRWLHPGHPRGLEGWGGGEFPATGGEGEMALRFDENFKFNPSLGWDMLNIIKNVAFLWTA